MRSPLFYVGQRVRFDCAPDSPLAGHGGEVVEVHMTRARGRRPYYTVRWNTGDPRDQMGVEEFEILPLNGWDTPADRSPATVERWLTS